MTERFEYNYKTGRICDNETDWQCTSNMLHIERRMNELDKVNKKLLEENEQLKKELKALRKKYNDFSNTVDKRLKELYK